LGFGFPLLVSGHLTVTGEQAPFSRIAQLLSLFPHQGAQLLRNNKPGWFSPRLRISDASLLFAAIPPDSDSIWDTIVF
jgi:hypothetical protein